MAAQQHLDSLSALDAAFLLQERPTSHMHIGGVAIFRGRPPAFEDFLAHIRSRLDRAPRYRQKLAYPPAGIGRPRWIDDPRFNIEYHVRNTSLPSPGTDAQLDKLVARIYSERLDRNKPLWELLLVEGLSGGRFAVISKTHHSVVDGVSGIDIATALFDMTPDVDPNPPVSAWVAHPEPSPAELAAVAVSGNARELAALPAKALATLADRTRLRGLGEAVMTVLRPAPASALNVEIGSHRRVAFVPTKLDDFKTVKNVYGGTVNDVLLAVTAGALRHWMHSRGLKTEGVELRAAVPVSVRTDEDHGALGNRLTQMVATLPIDVADPIARLRLVQDEMTGLKDSRQALGAEVIAGAQEFAPSTILAQTTRLNFSTRAYNLLVTNVPGPQMPLYLLGRQLDQIFPVAFLAGNRALAIAAMSYNGRVGFGLIGDYDKLDDIDIVADGIATSLAEYVALARVRGRRKKATPTHA